MALADMDHKARRYKVFTVGKAHDDLYAWVMGGGRDI